MLRPSSFPTLSLCLPFCPVCAGEKFDAFHELIAWEEICRLGSGGLAWGICEGIQIGVPPLLNFGTPEMRKIAQQCLMGEKVICLCISEPYAGSDVANIRCTAQKKRVLNKKTGVEEEVYVVNGEKKWITNGTYEDGGVTRIHKMPCPRQVR